MVNLEKYKVLLFQKIKRQMKEWFEKEPYPSVKNEEVYRFLHSIKGTAGSIELMGLHQLASKLMEVIEETSDKEWEKEELTDFLFELIGLSYEYEHFKGGVEKQEFTRNSHATLIQIIDDDISMLILLKDALEERGWMVVANSNPAKAEEQFYDLNPDCLILDINLPKQNGLNLLESLQSHNSKKFTPTIMISIDNSRENRIISYKLGADDFIPKPIDIEEFVIRVERQLARKQIFNQSVLIDELTQVYNRKFLEDSLQRCLNDVKRSNTYFSLAILDLDHFKKVNDTYGHLAGDQVLAGFAQFIKENIRSSDTVFRYGGEEFIILFPRATDLEAKEVLTRLLNEFSSMIFTENNESFSVTFSAGVYMVTKLKTSSSIIQTADQALYTAKERGRARVISANSLDLGRSKKKIFVSIIDDDAIIRTMLMKAIKSMDFNHIQLDIKVYEDGSVFFEQERHRENGQHFVILDGIMPVMDGIEVLRKLKEGVDSSMFQVLMLTGRKSEGDIAKALELGADDYVTKPFNISELQNRIERFINRLV